MYTLYFCGSPEKETQNPKVQKSKRCEIVKSNNRISQNRKVQKSKGSNVQKT